MKKLIALILLPIACAGDEIFDRKGVAIEGEIIESNGTSVLFKRLEDGQLFKFPLSELSDNSAKYIRDYHATERYSTPRFPTPLEEKQLKRFANHIDFLVDQKLKEKRLQKTRSIDDYGFIRRAHLTLIGRIPTEKEVEKWHPLSPNKKEELIDSLLKSKGYTEHHLNWLSDLFRVKDRPQGTNIDIGHVYRKYLRNSLEQNKSYKTIAKELISSNGGVYDSYGAATSFYLRDRGMQPDNLSHTVRVFLGTRLQCAMCHDHPFDRWTQKEFYEMTAFTSGIGNVRIQDQSKKIGKLSRLINEDGDQNAGIFNNWRNQVRDSIQYGIENEGTGQIKLPKDFAEANGEPGELIGAKAILAPPLSIPLETKNPKSRVLLAEWMTSDANPRFTTVIANRLWKRVFGLGLIEPLDDINDETFASNTELMNYLEELMFSLNYDMREFTRVLCNTELFGRSSVKHDYKLAEEFFFQGPVLRRMTGEQLWDSLVTLVFNNIDSKERVPELTALGYEKIYQKYKSLTAEEIYKEFKRIASLNEKVERNFLIANGILPNKNKIPQRDLVRSSYLRYPERGGHLMRQFGSSDKEQIENSNLEANTPQVLSLLNGFVETKILNNKNADFMKAMESENRLRGKIESVFLATLNRKPTSSETKDLQEFIDKPNGWKHVTWILLNSHEFIFIR